jgi:hypothetical protein
MESFNYNMNTTDSIVALMQGLEMVISTATECPQWGVVGEAAKIHLRLSGESHWSFSRFRSAILLPLNPLNRDELGEIISRKSRVLVGLSYSVNWLMFYREMSSIIFIEECLEGDKEPVILNEFRESLCRSS